MAGTAFAPGEPAQDILREMSSSPFSEAAEALRIMLSRKPKHFVSQQALSALGGTYRIDQCCECVDLILTTCFL